jgi:hypothetical protein
MSFTYDPTTNAGLVRLLITDTNSASPIFSDAEISAFLSLYSNVFNASAVALRVIATNQVLVYKVIQWLHLRTDGAKMADSLLALAKSYDDQAIALDAESAGLFDWAEFVDDPFAARERLIKEIERAGIFAV